MNAKKLKMFTGPEKLLDDLVDDMTDEEFATYTDFWDTWGLWRTNLNRVIRAAFLVLMLGFILDSDFWLTTSMVVGGAAWSGYNFLATHIAGACARQSHQILLRLGKI